jgi:hypothetical protein
MPAFQQADVALPQKLASIRAVSILFAQFGELVSDHFASAIPTYVERLSNLGSAIQALQGLTNISQAETKLDMSVFLKRHATVLSELLAKTTPRLPHNTLLCMSSLVQHNTSSLKASDLKTWTRHLAALLTEEQTDLTLSQYALDCAASLLACRGASLEISSTFLGPALALTQSKYVSGNALLSLANFFKVSANNGRERNMQFSQLKQSLMTKADSKRPKTIKPVARCLAAIISSASTSDAKTTIDVLVRNIKSSDHDAQLSLYTIGALSDYMDLSQPQKLGFKTACLAVFEHKNHAVRVAAATAVGNILKSDPREILGLLDPQQNRSLAKSGQVLLYVTALRGAIIAGVAQPELFQDYIEMSFAALSCFYDSKDQGLPGLISECLGRMCLIDSKHYAALSNMVLDRNTLATRLIAISALRHSLSGGTDIGALMTHFPNFMPILENKTKEGMPAKEALLQTITAMLALTKSAFTRENVVAILAECYKETESRPDLIEEIDYTYTKVLVDHHESLRTATFQCLGGFLEQLNRFITIKDFVTAIKVGLVDAKVPIQSYAYQVMIHLSKSNPDAVVEFLPEFFAIVRVDFITHMKKLKSTSITPEDRAVSTNRLKNCITGMLWFNELPGAHSVKTFQSLVGQVLKKDELRAIKEACEKETGFTLKAYQ